MTTDEETSLSQHIYFYADARNLQLGAKNQFFNFVSNPDLTAGLVDLRDTIQDLKCQVYAHAIEVDKIEELSDQSKYHEDELDRVGDLHRHLRVESETANALINSRLNDIMNTVSHLQEQHTTMDVSQHKWAECTNSAERFRNELQICTGEQQCMFNNLREKYLMLEQNGTKNEGLINVLNARIGELENQLLIKQTAQAYSVKHLGIMSIPEIDACPRLLTEISTLDGIKEQTRDWFRKRDIWFKQWDQWIATMLEWWTKDELIAVYKIELMKPIKEWIDAIVSGVMKMVNGHGCFVDFFEKVKSLPRKSRINLGWESIYKLNRRIKSIKHDQKVMKKALNDEIGGLNQHIFHLTGGLHGARVNRRMRFAKRDNNLCILLKQELHTAAIKEQLTRLLHDW